MFLRDGETAEWELFVQENWHCSLVFFHQRPWTSGGQGAWPSLVIHWLQFLHFKTMSNKASKLKLSIWVENYPQSSKYWCLISAGEGFCFLNRKLIKRRLKIVFPRNVKYSEFWLNEHQRRKNALYLGMPTLGWEITGGFFLGGGIWCRTAHPFYPGGTDLGHL